jgi:TolB protein
MRWKIACTILIAGVLPLSCKDIGTDPRAIVKPPIEEPIPTDDTPSWSPSGAWIAYRHTATDVNDSSYASGIFLIDSLGNQRKLLVAGNAISPDWSPNGNRIVFAAGDLFIFDIVRSDIQRLTNIGVAFFPAWSPDGRNLAFDTPYRDPTGSNAIWLINPDGSNLRDISRHGIGEWRNPDWSPRDFRIAHVRYITDGTSEIFTMDSTGNGDAQVTSNSHDDNHPRWSPDGSMLCWIAAGNKVSVMNRDGSDQRVIFNGFYAAWAPDSRRLVVSHLVSSPKRIVLSVIDKDGRGIRQITN